MELRKLMRTWSWCHAGVPLIRRELSLTKTSASKLLESLIAEGYVEEEPRLAVDHENRYIRSVKGAALAGASAAAPIRRELVRVRLHELIERMVRANADNRFYVGVQQAAVFGSYLSDADTLGDLDVHYLTYRKIENHHEFMRVTLEAAQESGRRFKRYLDLLSWPEDELGRFLKNRSRVYSLGDNSSLLADPKVKRVMLFSDRVPVLNWRSL